jgi:hypothetical protein
LNSSPSSGHDFTSRASDRYKFPDEERTKRAAEDLLNTDHGRPFYLGLSSAAFFLPQANSNIGQLKGKCRDKTFETNAERSLSDLTKTFAAVNFDASSNVRENVRSFRRKNEVFFIPEKEEGMKMMQSKPLLVLVTSPPVVSSS